MTVREFYESYRNRQLADMAYATFLSRTSLIRRNLVLPYGDRQIRSFSVEDINCIYRSMKNSGFSQNTIFGTYAALKSFFNLAVKYGYIDQNPVSSAETVHPLQRKNRLQK